jgi:predicted SAM-dependent methyltransferase
MLLSCADFAKGKEMKLNLGSGSLKLEDYENIDIKDGRLAYPLDVPDNSCDEIRASHILEHFSHRMITQVLSDWVAKLKDGGILKIAVPDFAKIVSHYKDKDETKLAYYLMGGQNDENDYHRCVFDYDSLLTVMEQAGLTDIEMWESDVNDCAGLPISLNLKGRKIAGSGMVSRKMSAIMSMPRLTFTDTLTCVMRHVVAKGIPFNRSSGVFWGQCLTRLIEAEAKKDLDYILTIDYDTWFTYDDVISLVQLLEKHPEYDAVMPVQIKRENDGPMIGVESPTGEDKIPITYFENEIVPANTGHFGLTVFRKSCFEKIKKPWFIPKPDKDGGWNDGRIDEDIMFWHNFKESGCKFGVATNVRVGHLQLKVTYPGPKSQGWKPVDVQVSDVEQGQIPDVLKEN